MKLTFFLLGLLIGLGSYYAYENFIEKKPDQQVTQTSDMDEGPTDSIDNRLKSVVIIDENDAKSFAKMYNREFRRRGPIGNKEHRSSAVWFSKDVVEMMYKALYQEEHKDLLDGFRIYFGKYADNYRDEKRKGMLTTFILLTKSTEKQDYHKDTFYFKELKKQPFNFNHGELCPNNCDTTRNYRSEY
jgi:hypothetical protein